jgi:hypothetical protein
MATFISGLAGPQPVHLERAKKVGLKAGREFTKANFMAQRGKCQLAFRSLVHGLEWLGEATSDESHGVPRGMMTEAFGTALRNREDAVRYFAAVCVK